jgi:hypothetical protein
VRGECINKEKIGGVVELGGNDLETRNKTYDANVQLLLLTRCGAKNLALYGNLHSGIPKSDT